MYMKILCKISTTDIICWSKNNFLLIMIHNVRIFRTLQKASQQSFSKCFNIPGFYQFIRVRYALLLLENSDCVKRDTTSLF